nr:MAG TPA: hypothetical protein [Caudoviricetes sp.]
MKRYSEPLGAELLQQIPSEEVNLNYKQACRR